MCIQRLIGWSHRELADGVLMTGSPLSDRAIKRSQAFFPIDPTLSVETVDGVTVTMLARPANKLIAWDPRHPATGRRFSNSIFHGKRTMPRQFVRSRGDYVPKLSFTVRAKAVVVAFCDGQRSFGDIQAAMSSEHPHLLSSDKTIARFIASVLSVDTE